MSNQANVSRIEVFQELYNSFKYHVTCSHEIARRNLKALSNQLDWIRSEVVSVKSEIDSLESEIESLDPEEDYQLISRLNRNLEKQQDLLKFLLKNARDLGMENKDLQSTIRLLSRKNEEISTVGQKELSRNLNILGQYSNVMGSTTGGGGSTKGHVGSSPHKMTESLYKNVSHRAGSFELLGIDQLTLSEGDLNEVSKSFENQTYTSALDRELKILVNEVEHRVREGYTSDDFEKLDSQSGKLGAVDGTQNIFIKYFQDDAITVTKVGDAYDFTNGRHRVQRARALDIESLPVLILFNKLDYEIPRF